MAQGATKAVQEAAEQQVTAVVDSAKLKAAAEAERLIGEAERQATQIRAEAQTLSETVKRGGLPAGRLAGGEEQ